MYKIGREMDYEEQRGQFAKLKFGRRQNGSCGLTASTTRMLLKTYMYSRQFSVERSRQG